MLDNVASRSPNLSHIPNFHLQIDESWVTTSAIPIWEDCYISDENYECMRKPRVFSKTLVFWLCGCAPTKNSGFFQVIFFQTEKSDECTNDVFRFNGSFFPMHFIGKCCYFDIPLSSFFGFFSNSHVKTTSQKLLSTRKYFWISRTSFWFIAGRIFVSCAVIA